VVERKQRIRWASWKGGQSVGYAEGFREPWGKAAAEPPKTFPRAHVWFKVKVLSGAQLVALFFASRA
jgi:hypothetical protein